MDGLDLALELIALVVKVAPGVLALITGEATDEEALAKARASIARIRPRPAASALDAHVARAEKP